MSTTSSSVSQIIMSRTTSQTRDVSRGAAGCRAHFSTMRDADLSGGRLRSTRRPAAVAAETRAPTAASNAGAAAAASTSSGTTRVARCLIGVAAPGNDRTAASYRALASRSDSATVAKMDS